MKNFKKVIFALMVVFLVVGFIGCKTESDSKDSPAPVNNFIGTWMMDDLSTECVITEDAFTTYVEEYGDFPGTYTLNKDNKSAVAKFTVGGEEKTVDMALLEGETDVAEMDLSSFDMGESIFVKYREGEFDIVGTWSDGTLNIVITNEGYTVTAVADPTNTPVSEGTVSKEGNTFTLVENESSDEISTGVLSTNGKAYCYYYDPISGDGISASFTKSN